MLTLRWRHTGRDNVSNHQPHDCLLNRLFGRKSKKTSKLRITGLCAGNSPGTGEFPAQMASNAEKVSIWWRHHDFMPVSKDMLTDWLVDVLPAATYKPSSGNGLSVAFLTWLHYNDVIMGAMASQIHSLAIVYSTVYSGSDQRKHQSSASLAFVSGDRWIPRTKGQ